MTLRLRKGQAMVETLLAAIFITFLLLFLFQLMNMLTSRILLDHAAARAARAKSVGFNDYMCLKSARVAMIPVAGKRVWPEEDIDEVSRVPIYLAAEGEGRARGILEYDRWRTMDVDLTSGAGLSPVVRSEILMDTEEWSMDGSAEVESHFPLYMNDQGL